MLSFFAEYSRAQNVIRKRYDVVFYAESGYYFQYFRHLLEGLAGKGLLLCYITSDAKDSLLQEKREGVEVLFLKHTAAFVFPRLQARFMILTMPDLQRFLFKRSPGVGEYIYVFHALVSTHQQYRAHAFDHYDTVFCCGPHHVAEMEKGASVYRLSPRKTVDYGYPLLEALRSRSAAPKKEDGKTVLLAPSWYEEGIFRTCITELSDLLARSGQRTLIRPHPEFIKRNRKAFRQLEALAERNDRFSLDTNPSITESLLAADYLITDRSGIAFEYAFVKRRGVLFIDTPPKVQNREGHLIGLEPAENRYRTSVGLCINPGELEGVFPSLEELDRRAAQFEEGIEEAEKAMVFPPSCHQRGIDYILEGISS